jgi:hypothetical protein
MTETEHLVKRLPNDIGGLPAEPIQRVDHVLEPWEKRCGVEALGAEMVSNLTYYERWIVAFANILFRKAILTPEELARKMDEVAARWPDGPRSAPC